MATASAFTERRGIGDDNNSFTGNNSANMGEPVTMRTGSMLQMYKHGVERAAVKPPQTLDDEMPALQKE